MELATPCLLVDETKLKENIRRMAELSQKTRTALRPHVKTHKTAEIAHMQMAAGAVGITVAKVSEAEVMAAAGIGDIFVAYPLVTEEKIERALDLSERGRIVFALDSVEGARMLSQATIRRGKRVEARLEIDTGMRRTGVPPAQAARLAQAIRDLAGIDLRGIFTFRGAMIDGKGTLDRRTAGLDEGRTMAGLAEQLRAGGTDIVEVSVGSTPTAESAATVTGVTEVRPGTYVFNDRMQVAYGACSIDDCALSVLVTVVSTPSSGRIVVDGGSKTFSTDAVPGSPPLCLRGHGEVLGSPDLLLDRLSEEHGVIELPKGGPPVEKPRIGDRLRVIPNHVCTTVNLHSRLWLVDALGKPTRELSIAARGMVT